MAEGQAGSKRKSAPAHDPKCEVRAALREAERAEWIGHIHEIKYLREQVDYLCCTEPVSKDHELELITQQLKQKAARDRLKTAAKTNSTETFTCGICMECQPLQVLHINVPCGHGFCKTCIAQKPTKRAAAPGTKCFSCQRQVGWVVQTQH